MAEIRHLILFIHSPVTYSYHRLLEPAPDIADATIEVAASQASDETVAACVIQGGGGDPDLVSKIDVLYGDRSIIDPEDPSDETRVLLSQDLDRTLSGRGSHGEWNIYEIWSSNNARRWAEGIRKALDANGHTIDGASLTVETFGSWSGCHHKYSNFLPVYLGGATPADIHAEIRYCTFKGMPMEVAECVETVQLERGVQLFVFLRKGGRPMAQFWDGLRPVWDPPHVAEVSIDPSSVDLINLTPNSFCPVTGKAGKGSDSIIAVVGDGCHPAYTTVVERADRKPSTQLRRSYPGTIGSMLWSEWKFSMLPSCLGPQQPA